MAKGAKSKAVAPGEQPEASSSNSAMNSKSTLKLNNKRKADNFEEANYPSPESNDDEQQTLAKEQPPKRARKKAAPKNGNNDEQSALTEETKKTKPRKKAPSKKRTIEEQDAADTQSPPQQATAEQPPVKKARKKPAPKESKTDDQFTTGNYSMPENLAATGAKPAAEATDSAETTGLEETAQPAETMQPTEATATKIDATTESDVAPEPAVTAAVEASATLSKKRKSSVEQVETEISASLQIEGTESAESPAKKPKRISARTSKPTARKLAADASKPRRKKSASDTNLPPPVPPPPPPAEVTKEVANKIAQVHRYIDENHPSRLDRDLENKHLVSVPESSVLSAVIRMRAHWQLGRGRESSISDVEEAIEKRFKQPIGDVKDIDWVTVDISKQTDFESQIKEKIARHGLEHANLLEIELEMFRLDHLKRYGLIDEEKTVAWDAQRFLRTINEMWKKVNVDGDENAAESNYNEDSIPDKYFDESSAFPDDGQEHDNGEGVISVARWEELLRSGRWEGIPEGPASREEHHMSRVDHIDSEIAKIDAELDKLEDAEGERNVESDTSNGNAEDSFPPEVDNNNNTEAETKDVANGAQSKRVDEMEPAGSKGVCPPPMHPA